MSLLMIFMKIKRLNEFYKEAYVKYQISYRLYIKLYVLNHISFTILLMALCIFTNCQDFPFCPIDQKTYFAHIDNM